MFTGIITSIGEISKIEKDQKGYLISVQCEEGFLVDVKKGSSIAINGICFTIIDMTKNIFTVEAMKETIDVTTIKNWDLKYKVNLEKAMLLSDRLDGHIVQGHVDSVSEITNIEKKGDSRIYNFKIEKKLASFVVKKGSVSIDGVSLTIIDSNDEKFSIGIITHTFINTIFQYYEVGDFVNVETDIIGKYIRKLEIIDYKL